MLHFKYLKFAACFCTVLLAFSLSACSGSVEETINQPELKYETQYPASAQEYNLMINKKITPFLNELEGHISKGKNIIDGTYPLSNELTSVEDTLTYVNEIYESCKVIMPPDSERERHSNTLMQMQRAINSIEVYQETLKDTSDITQTVQKNSIISCINVMESEFASLKNMFNIEV